MLPLEALNQLKTFVKLVKETPQLLHTPELSFFKEFVESFGGVIPPASCSREPNKPPQPEEKKPPASENIEESSSEESDVELDITGVIGGYYFFFLKTLVRSMLNAECAFLQKIPISLSKKRTS